MSDLKHKIIKQGKCSVDHWYGNKLAGDFYSYGEKKVKMYIEHNKTGCDINARGYQMGFYVTILTIDDLALYADWYCVLDNDKINKVLFYFNNTLRSGLREANTILKDLEKIIGIKADAVDFS